MKKTLLFITLALILSSFQSTTSKQIVEAFKNNKATDVAQHFDNTIEISFDGNTNNYNHNQAETVLIQFLLKNPARNFEIIHQSDNGSSAYLIGNLTTSAGVYRTTVFLKNKNNQTLIQEMRFENK
ncbi:MAG: DUF4783 domain-containing protein [Ginsengibacter sp.]